MPSSTLFGSCLLPCVVLLACCYAPVVAFGAGNIASIAKIEGQNWRHGDIEDALLNILMARAAGGKKFGKLDVKRVYFGNWLRDYSQAVDVGTVKYVSAEAIRIILWVLGFMSFGYATKEFEVTTDRLGCYRPEEHIDNPKDYADNIDARQYDRRLRGPIDERRELSVDPETGLKNYIASEHLGITTSAGLIRNVFGRSIQLGRRYAQGQDKADLYEALRLLGTGCHCLEDYSAHSNYTELALIELGERGVFPHVGRRTQVELPGARQPVYPLITGTFGGVDFLHSVMGEFSDKTIQSEIQELEGTIEQSQDSGSGNPSMLQDLLNQIPSGLFGDKDEASKVEELQANAQAAQLQNTHITPRDPEAWTVQLQEVSKQIYPILEWHDEIMQSITETIESIPVLPDLIENLQEQLNVFVFGLLAPFVLPIIQQVKSELNTGSSEIIQSSREKQHIVFHDDYSSDPTHSMLSKDHFSNVLNEPAGKVASQVVKWVVPQLIACWDDESIDVNRTLTRVVNGVFNHPALRDYGDDGAVDGRRLMFGVVEEWWGGKDEQEREILRDQLGRDGVEQGRNHKEGVHDSGHGCGKPLGMPNMKTAGSSGAIGGPAAGVVFGGGSSDGVGKLAGEAVGGGALGGIVGGLVSGLGGDLLGGAFDDSNAEKQSYQRQKYDADGSYTQSVTQTGYSQPEHGRGQQKYGQAEYSQTNFSGGGQRQKYQRYEQGGDYGQSGYGQRVIQESRPTYGGGYEQTTERRYDQPGGGWQSDIHQEGINASNEHYEESKHYEGRGSYRKDSDDDESDKEKKHKKKYHEGYASYEKKSDDDSDDEKKYKKHDKYDKDSDDEKKYKNKHDSDDEKKYKKKHNKHDDDSDDENTLAYGERLRGHGEERRPYGEQQSYSNSRQEYGQGYESRTGGEGYQSEDRYRGSHPAYASGEYGDRGNEGYSSRGQGYEGEGEGYGRQQDEYGRRDEYRQQERSEGYGQRDEYQQERPEGYGQREGYQREERSEGYGGYQGYGQGDERREY